MASSVRRINDPNAPADSIVVQTIDGTRVAVKKAWYNQLKNDIENAAVESRRGRHTTISYEDYASNYPWSVLVFPLLWDEIQESVSSYTDYDPFDADSCSLAIEDVALKIMTKKARMV